ncbi:MAG: biotin synthase BioB [Planctomycetota bacterium]|jgi:biotin synthase
MNGIDTAEALDLLRVEGPRLFSLLALAGEVRYHHRGETVTLCAVLNAKSGTCPEDCAFCAQSVHAKTKVETYPLMGPDRMVAAAREAVTLRANRFGIVTSGKKIAKAEEIEAISEAIRTIAQDLPLEPCASLGTLDFEGLRQLKEAGLRRYHHNLETAESFFPKVCSTRRYAESLDTIAEAKAVGLRTCCGGIFGLGETLEQRIELLDSIRRLDVDSVPLNFLNPIPGTRLENRRDLKPLDCLRIIAVARLMMPDKEIRVCGGREVNLRDLQSWTLPAGADGLMVGGYLTTSGRDVSADHAMIADAGFTLAKGGTKES